MTQSKKAPEGVILSNKPQELPSEDAQTSELKSLQEKIEALISHVEFLENRVEDQERLTPGWIDPEVDETKFDPKKVLMGMQGNEEEGVADQLLFGTDSHPIPDIFLRKYGPKFRINQKVRLNPDADIHGTSGVKWGPHISESGKNGIGIIKKVSHLTDKGEWKYVVRIPGITQKNGSGFMESELLPVKQKVARYVIEEQ